MLIRAGASVGFVDGEPHPGMSVRFPASGSATAGGGPASGADGVSPADFPGRWNRRRAVAPELAPLPRAAAEALEAAGRWRRGAGETCRGGLIVANDTAPVLASLGFTREIHAGAGAAVRPAGFLTALPSTAASVLGLLFGLTDYQACVVSGALSGAQALGHALDSLRLERLDRVLVASLSVLGEVRRPRIRLAVALCIESGAEGTARAPTLDCGVSAAGATAGEASPSAGDGILGDGILGDGILGDLARELPPGAAGLASVPLLLVAKYCEKWFSGADPVPVTYHHEEPLTGGQASITLR